MVSGAGLVPVLALAEETGLSTLVDEHVRFDSERIRSAAANPTGKVTSIIAGMLTGADSIDDLQAVRSGGAKKLFGAVYASATLLLVRGDSAYGYSDVIATVVDAGAKFSFVLTKNQSVNRAIGAITDDAWTPVRYPGAVIDPTPEGGSPTQKSPKSAPPHSRHRHACHRQADSPSRQRPQPPRRDVPGLAVSPVLHRQHRTRHQRRHHPPATCDRRIGVRRPHLRALGTPALRAVFRQRGMDDPGRHRPQSARSSRHSSTTPTPSPAAPPCDDV